MEIASLSLYVAGSIPTPTIQATINMAAQNPRGAVWVPSNYQGTDSYSNPNSVPIFDMRFPGSLSFGGGGGGTSNRLVLSGATALVAGSFSIAGWGSGAAVSAVHGSDGAHYFTITAGSSPSTGPTIGLTFVNGAWSFAPIVDIEQMGGTGSFADVSVISTTTSYTATFLDTPLSGNTYIFRAILVGPVS